MAWQDRRRWRRKKSKWDCGVEVPFSLTLVEEGEVGESVLVDGWVVERDGEG